MVSVGVVPKALKRKINKYVTELELKKVKNVPKSSNMGLGDIEATEDKQDVDKTNFMNETKVKKMEFNILDEIEFPTLKPRAIANGNLKFVKVQQSDGVIT